jgi:hypothetical protein
VSKPRRKRNRRIAARRKPIPSARAICIVYGDGGGRHLEVALLDLSLFGAGLAVAVPVAVGTPVAIGLQATGKPRSPVIPAKVVWCGPVAGTAYRIGTQFEQPLTSTVFQALCGP